MHLKKVVQVTVPIRLRLITQPGFYLEFGKGFKVTRLAPGELVICSVTKSFNIFSPVL